MSGLVQDYSKSPIRANFSREQVPQGTPPPSLRVVPNALDATFVPAAMQAQSSPYAPAQQQVVPNSSLSSGYSVPPPRGSIDASLGARPQSDQAMSPLITPDTQLHRPAPSYPYPSHPQPPMRSVATGPPGYQQSSVHNDGDTGYSMTDAQSGREIAEQAWQSVSQVAGNAGETVGKALEGGWGSVKGWLNPESKGMR